MANQLIHEQSPYLLQHAHNPVDWHPWSDEAFAKAGAENKPVIISIGYAACHWCHVMERESFEDAQTAAYMNAHFVCIKVDREEHPDVDALYMDAVQAISGSGGWPLNAFATPERIPFYGGTYFPPRPAFNRPSWMQVLVRMHDLWTAQPEEVRAQSEQMVEYLQKVAKPATGATSGIIKDDCERMAEALLKMADKEWGGFGAAPKFPGTMAIAFLLENHYYTGNEVALAHALLSLDCMIEGGIHDQIGGGFSRYSTDREWLAPHFEKMLYDNALLISTLCDAVKLCSSKNQETTSILADGGYAARGNFANAEADEPGRRVERYKEVIRETIAFVNRELRDENSGAFYSALDADSEGEEGKFYTWTWPEWNKIICGDPLPASFFGVSESGNWEHTNILHQSESPTVLAEAFRISEEEVLARIDAAKQKLVDARSTRIRPQTDDKSLLSWNALMNIALTKAGVVLEEQRYLEQAGAHMQWMMEAFLKGGRLNHVWKNNHARIPAKLDDYVYLMSAMIQLGAATGAPEWIVEAARLGEVVNKLFGEEAGGCFFYLSSSGQTDVAVRKIDVYDGATPSANAVLAGVLQSLGMLMERSDWTGRGAEMISRMAGTAARYPYSFAHWVTLAQRSTAGLKTIVVAGRDAAKAQQELNRVSPPHAIIINALNAAKLLPLAAGKESVAETLIFVCTESACMPPVSNSHDALSLL